MAKQVYAIEGIDRVSKSTLINSILNELGFYQVIHFSKPEVLERYERAVQPAYEQIIENYSKFLYQQESFRNSMLMVHSGARLIFDRWAIGEVVYAPMYRNYSGDYIFELEQYFMLDTQDIRLILLLEDFQISKHFISDGQSFNDNRREEEQDLFIEAFNRSIIQDKRMIWVTDPDTGQFKSKERILEETLK